MKKLLLASTALVMTAGVAAADVALSGNARMGFLYDGNDVKFTSRSRVIFTMSGETDGGLAFGASFRADQAGAANGLDMTGGSVFVSGEFGRLTMGDVSGAAEWIVGDLAGVGLTGLNDLNENAYLSNAGAAQRTAARYQYELDGLKLAVSADQPTAALNAYSIGVGYTFEGFGAGIGYEDNGPATHAIGYLSASFSGVTGKLTYGRATGSVDQYGLSVTGTFDATTVTAFARRDFADNTHYGVGGSYNLGGGASIVGGVVRQDLGATSNTIADFGLSFSF
jgi:outer membrane protein OmpU